MPDDDPPTVRTDLTPAEIEAAQYRAIHELRGTYYDEQTMQQIDSHRVRWPAAAPRADSPPPQIDTVFTIDANAQRELRVIVDALDAGYDQDGGAAARARLAYTQRIRELVGL